MKKQSGIAIIAVVPLCLLIAAVSFFVGHKVHFHLDPQTQQ